MRPVARTARSVFVISATALALHKGGMTLCGGTIMALRDALDAFPRAASDDEVAAAHGRAREVILARLAGDEVAFNAAKYALEVEMAALWALRARAYARGAAA
ncbi:hypothetical protein [Salipiger mangrovisoli]|uniref:Uncharacterized protein n=1 Tax=Salipiger mangrovisoli TaxID=2865933 RepID=A0ABR9WWU9_9RHOB|nr:hypothetical protein [Salipiger mangrovisoli]MBE9635763.1 hypothetical protein [Salipiger mangrovisoli]